MNHQTPPGIAVVTGGGQGIGQAICTALAEDGWRLAVLDINEAAALQTARRLQQDGADAQAFHVDIADPDSVRQAMTQVGTRMGAVGVLVNNAAMFSTLTRKPFDDITPQEWESVMRVNICGTFWMCQAAARAMRAQGAGRIINISSNTAALGRPFFLHYVTSKGALVSMTRALARELGSHGITVNAIMPSLTRTGVPTQVVDESHFDALLHMQCIPRNGLPDDIAQAVCFLASSRAAFITGQTLAVDGGAAFL